MSLIVIVWAVLFSIFLSVPSAYYFYMKRSAKKPWNLKTDGFYEPSITILIPAHNEENVIQLKLENAEALEYGGEREIIVIDDGSTDKTFDEVSEFVESHPEANIRMLRKKERAGKSGALNFGVKHAKGDIIIVADADCFWPRDILSKALPYLADPSVGAVIGRQVLLNPQQSWVTKSEEIYYENYALPLRVGESKIHSSFASTEGFCAYKRSFLGRLRDDSETVLDITQKKGRSIVVPEVLFYTTFPATMINKMNIKVRRANQLVRVSVRWLALMLRKKLVAPKRVVLPQIYLHLVNPLVFLALLVATGLLLLEFPILAVFACMLPALLISRVRIFLSEAFLGNCLVLCALITCVIHKEFKIWRTVEESRLFLNRQMLEREGLLFDAGKGDDECLRESIDFSAEGRL